MLRFLLALPFLVCNRRFWVALWYRVPEVVGLTAVLALLGNLWLMLPHSRRDVQMDALTEMATIDARLQEEIRGTNTTDGIRFYDNIVRSNGFINPGRDRGTNSDYDNIIIWDNTFLPNEPTIHVPRVVFNANTAPSDPIIIRISDEPTGYKFYIASDGSPVIEAIGKE